MMSKQEDLLTEMLSIQEQINRIKKEMESL